MVLKAKYFPNQSIFKYKISQNASWFQQSIMAVGVEVESGVRKRVGTGRSIRIWEDNRIPNNSKVYPTTEIPTSYKPEKIEELISNFRWKGNLIFRTFNSNDAEKILRIPISVRNEENRYFWMHSKIWLLHTKDPTNC